MGHGARQPGALTAEQVARYDDQGYYGRRWRDHLPGYFHLMSNPKVLDAVEPLIGSEIFANPVITVWIALVDATHGPDNMLPR